MTEIEIALLIFCFGSYLVILIENFRIKDLEDEVDRLKKYEGKNC